ncbi:MAG: 1-acyl-sn-glycerol-3-phosphate acyltransferase [Firmicutes bacterium]|nr:1-acyl-sn-glycerol-3-phosphate acyltransferase [Bacillota bacterium]
MLAWVTSAQKSGGGESAVQTPQNDKKKTVKKKKKKKDKGAGFFRTLFFYLIKAIVYLPRKLLYPAKIIHKKRLPKKSAHIVVSNHLCWKDIIHHVFTLPRRRSIVAKQELAKSRFIRAFRKTAGIIFIDRENPSLESVREILKTLKRGEPISIFPEGTRNKDSRELLEIKPGAGVFAVKTGAPIIPVMVYKRAKTFRKNYLYVGEPLDLSAYKGMRLTSELTEEITAKVRAAMLRTMEEMDDYVENKRWKRKNKKAVTSDETT